MSNREINQPDPFETDYFVNWYDNYRCSLDDLFPSETHYLKEFCYSAENLLDVGCAVGGMSKIILELNQKIHYEGVDISEKMIDQAKKNYPNIPFYVVDGIELPYSDEHFDSVLSFGTLVHEQKWKDLLTELWRVTSNQLILDVRLTSEQPTLSNIKRSFVVDGSNMPYPYVVINSSEFFMFIQDELNGIKSINAYGYWGRANEFTTMPDDYSQICMVGLILKKKPGNIENKLSFNLPFEVYK